MAADVESIAVSYMHGWGDASLVGPIGKSVVGCHTGVGVARRGQAVVSVRPGGHYQIAMDYLRQIGMDGEIQIAPRAEWGIMGRGQQFIDLHSEVWAAEYGTPTGPIAAYWSQNGWRPQNVSDAVFDEYFENALAATTREEQKEWARKADLRVAEQLWVIRGPLAPLFGASQPWIKGYAGETDLGLNSHKTWLAYVWVDQDLKREMGF